MSCPICLDEYSYPKCLPRVLQCGHSVCCACIVQVSQARGNFSCPLDRITCTWSPEQGAKQFPLNHSLIEALSLQEKDERNPRKMVTCDSCKKIHSVVHCQTCNAFFCRGCDKLEHMSALMARHPRIPVDLYTPTRTCPKHLNMPLRLQCLCNKDMICEDCAIVGEHAGHALRHAEEAAEEKKEELQHMLADLQGDTETLSQRHQPLPAAANCLTTTGPVMLTPATFVMIALGASRAMQDACTQVCDCPVQTVLDSFPRLVAGLEEVRELVALALSLPCQADPKSGGEGAHPISISETATALSPEVPESQPRDTPMPAASSDDASTATDETTTPTPSAIIQFVKDVRLYLRPFVLQALAGEVTDVSSYPSMNPDRVLQTLAPLTYAQGAWLLACAEEVHMASLGLWALSRCLGTGQTAILPDGTVADLVQMCRQAIQVDPKNYLAYNAITYGLAGDHEVTMADGAKMNTIQLLTECIDLNPDYAHPYQNLANALGDGRTVGLKNGRTLSRSQLYWEALRCDPMYHVAYNGLGNALEEDSIVLADGRTMNKQSLYIEAIGLNPDYCYAYFNLACMLHSPAVTLLDGRHLTEKQLYIEALRCDTEYSYAFNNLALLMAAGETIRLHDGRTLTKREMYVEAIRFNPKYAYAYNNLGVDLGKEETISLPDGRDVGKQQLYMEAMRCDASYKQPVLNLVGTLEDGESIELFDGRVVTKEELSATVSGDEA